MAVRQRTKEIMKKVIDVWAICKLYQKTLQRPVVGLSIQECISGMHCSGFKTF